MTTSVTCGTALGGLAGCFPPLAFVVAVEWFSIPGRAVPGLKGLYAIIMLAMYVPVGAVCGLIGGVFYGLKQRLLTAASLCVGVLGGGIVAMGVYGIDVFCQIIPPDWMYLLQFAGVFLGILYTKLSWRRASR
jgi:hypothetical protein